MSLPDIRALDERVVLQVLSEATAELHDLLPDQHGHEIATTSEAQAFVQYILESQGEALPGDSLDGRLAGDSGRVLLNVMLEDPQTRTVIDPLLKDPPKDQQKSVEVAVSAAIILGGLIAWLQTKIDIQVTRSRGKTEFSFKLRKESTNPEIIKKVVSQVAEILRGGS